MQDTAKELIKIAREKNMATVIDADGLYLIQNHPDIIKGYKKAVLTPNVVEFKRLCETMVFLGSSYMAYNLLFFFRTLKQTIKMLLLLLSS